MRLWRVLLVAVVACGGGRELASYRLAVVMTENLVGDVWIVDGRGQPIRRVTQTPDRAEMWPTFSPDGTQLFYEARVMPQRHVSLRRFHLDTGSEEVLYDPGAPGELWPTLSPDGSMLAYVTVDSGPHDLVVMDVATGERRVVNRPGELLIRPEWSPDSRRLLCQSREREDQPWKIVVVDLGSGTREHVGTDTDVMEFKARWSPDGREVVFSVRNRVNPAGIGLAIWDAERKTLSELLPGTAQRVVSAAWSSAGRLAAVRERPLPMALLVWQGEPGTKAYRVVSLSKRFRQGRVLWSPDGKYALVNARSASRKGGSRWHVWVFDEGGRKVCQWRTRQHVFCPAWAPMASR